MFQPVRISLESTQSNTTVITKLDGLEVDRRSLAAGSQVFEVLVSPVVTPQHAMIAVEGNGAPQTSPIDLKPVRKVLVYILPHSHHDLGYTDLQANVEEKQMKNITLGIELARKTAQYPEGARFVWNLEVLWGADLFMQRRSAAEKAEFFDAIRKGWIGLNGSYANELTGLCRPEELLQLFRYGTQLGKEVGVKVDSAMMSDVPGFSWGTVTAMAQAGIRYFSAAPNFFDRIGTFMTTWQDRPFWWVSPSGKEKVLVWVPWTGYAMSHVMKVSPEWVGSYQDRLDEVNFPYDISCIRWSGHGDNAEPDPEISEFVRSWNEQHAWPKFAIASTSVAFAAFEEEYGRQLPQFQGDLTPYWEDGAGSSALETKMNRTAADRLTQASALAAMQGSGVYSAPAYGAAWREVLLYSEHTWGAWCSVSDSENPFTTKQWDVKREFAVQAQQQSEALLTSALRHGDGTANIPRVDVYNTSAWDRSEIVLLSRELSMAGDSVTDSRGNRVASQRISTGELAVFAKNVPAFGSMRYSVTAGEAHQDGAVATVNDGVLQNGIVRAKIDLKTGDLIELNLHNSSHNLIDSRSGVSANKYVFLAGNDLAHLGHSGPATITIEEHGPLVASVRIESSAMVCNGLVRRMRLMAGADYIELNNVVDKKRAALNPHPGQGNQGSDFAQRGSKESVQFAFPFDVPGGTMKMDIPLAVMQPEIDQLPGSCKNWLPVGRWVDVSNATDGITWVTLDAPLIEVGGITATMLGSQKDPNVWRKHIEPTQTVYSWVMNNHWGTNYRAYQEGPVEFRYALCPHRGYVATTANRLATGLSQPLLATRASGRQVQMASLLRVEPSDVAVLTLKQSDDGKAWIVRLFGASGEARNAKLTWSSSRIGKTWRSNLAEEALTPVEGNVAIAGWELVTLRVERS